MPVSINYFFKPHLLPLFLLLGARVIVDLSWPYINEPDVNGDEPISVNDGIDMSLYPTSMTSIEAVLELINGSGPASYLVKQDWADGECAILK